MKNGACVAFVSSFLLLVVAPAPAFRGMGGFGGGMHLGGHFAANPGGFRGGFGPTVHGVGRFGGGMRFANRFPSTPGTLHRGFGHFAETFHPFPHDGVFFRSFGHPFFFVSSHVLITTQPFFFPPFGLFVTAPFFCFPCGLGFPTEVLFFEHLHRFHHFHTILPHRVVSSGSHVVFVGA